MFNLTGEEVHRLVNAPGTVEDSVRDAGELVRDKIAAYLFKKANELRAELTVANSHGTGNIPELRGQLRAYLKLLLTITGDEECEKST